ncbi:MAG TPA: peptidoglycan bridge formation glycyltransferase FemA/FemB family protein [Terriglobales bacterium]
MTLHILESAELTPAITRDISGFLDEQRMSHPFQYPQCSMPGTRFALFRQAGKPRWFAGCGIQRPLGRRVPWVRSVIINRGPVCDDARLWRSVLLELIQHLRHQNGYIYVDATPEWVDSDNLNATNLFDGDWTQISPVRMTLRLDLTRSPDELFAAFRKNSRYEIRRAERLGTSVFPEKSDADVNEFLGLYTDMAERKGFAADSPDRLRQFIEWFRQEEHRGALLLATHHGSILGGAVIVRAGTRCWYVWGASQKHEQVNVGHLLQWRAILWAREHGCTEYDFGGYTPGATSGPAWFKEGFGGSLVRLVPAHRRVIRPASNRLAQFLSKFR